MISEINLSPVTFKIQPPLLMWGKVYVGNICTFISFLSVNVKLLKINKVFFNQLLFLNFAQVIKEKQTCSSSALCLSCLRCTT